MLVIKKRFPLNSRYIIGTAVFALGFVGASSLLHRYVPRNDLQSDVVLTPKSDQEKEAIPSPVAPTTSETTSSDPSPNTYGYRSWPVKAQSPTVAPVAPVESTPVTTPEDPPATEQPPTLPPEEEPDPEVPEEPAPEEPQP